MQGFFEFEILPDVGQDWSRYAAHVLRRPWGLNSSLQVRPPLSVGVAKREADDIPQLSHMLEQTFISLLTLLTL